MYAVYISNYFCLDSDGAGSIGHVALHLHNYYTLFESVCYFPL